MLRATELFPCAAEEPPRPRRTGSQALGSQGATFWLPLANGWRQRNGQPGPARPSVTSWDGSEEPPNCVIRHTAQNGFPSLERNDRGGITSRPRGENHCE